MNLAKCSFGVLARNFFQFLVHQQGIKVDRNKVKVVLEARPPANKKELQSRIGKINFMRRFVGNLVGKVKAFSPLLRLKQAEKLYRIVNSKRHLIRLYGIVTR